MLDVGGQAQAGGDYCALVPLFPPLTLHFFSGTSAQPQVQERGRPGKGHFPAVPQRPDLQPGGLSGEVTWFTLFQCRLATVGLLVKSPFLFARLLFPSVLFVMTADLRGFDRH